MIDQRIIVYKLLFDSHVTMSALEYSVRYWLQNNQGPDTLDRMLYTARAMGQPEETIEILREIGEEILLWHFS